MPSESSRRLIVVNRDFSLRLIIIASDNADVLSLPWELMRLPAGDFIGFDAK
jgi:hypothetical protein